MSFMDDQTKEINAMIEARRFAEAQAMRGKQFLDSQKAFITFARPAPHLRSPSLVRPSFTPPTFNLVTLMA